ncbi:hypothetical protein GCM10027417_05530 [Glutamicibacter endophyticus]
MAPESLRETEGEEQELPPQVYRRLNSLADLPTKGRISHTGYVQSVSYSAAGEHPSLTAVVVDRLGGAPGRRGSQWHVKLNFMGQRTVPGIKPGVKIAYGGMVAPVGHVPTIYNPRYVILPQRVR